MYIYGVQANNMYNDKLLQTDTELLQAGVEALGRHGIAATVGKPRTTGKERPVRLKLGRQVIRYLLLLEPWLTPAALGHLARHPRTDHPLLLLTHYVTPHMAGRLRQLGINFVDAAGNAYLEHGPVLIWVLGHKAVTATRPPRAGRAFQPGGLKVLFALLCTPDLVNQPTRTIAMQAGVANGTVGIVLNELREGRFLVALRQRRGKRTLRNLKALLDQWTQTYARTLRPQLLVARYRPPDPEWWRKVNPCEHRGVFGGEAAEALLTGTLARPEIVTVYLPDAPGRFILTHRLINAADGTMEIRKKFWPFEYTWEHPALAPPLLIYADLLATGDARCLEAAQRIYDQHLARLVATE